MGADLCDQRRAVGQLVDFVALVAQDLGEELAPGHVVVDDEDSAGSIRGRSALGFHASTQENGRPTHF